MERQEEAQMADRTTELKGQPGRISAATRSVLEKLAPAEAINVMDEMLRAASGGNNNNNNDSNGGSGCAGRAGLNREELLQKISASMSDDQLHAVLKQQGII
jgi:hypothetical protein